MRLSPFKQARSCHSRRGDGWLLPFVLFAALLTFLAQLSACSVTPSAKRALYAIPPLQLPSGSATVEDARSLISSPDLFALDAPMRKFLDDYVGDVVRDRQRMMMLHRAIRGSATLGLDYDSAVGGTAQEVFHRGTANCLGYATLFIALARAMGLNAGYQWLEVRPQWTQRGERVLVSLHVNVAIRIGRRERFMIDIEPPPSRDVTGSRALSDADGLALYHSNLAMEALAEDDLREAWLQTVRALQLSPELAHLWVNLGAIYRVAGQHRAAEDSYHQALALNPLEHSAMNNLVVLLELEGRETERRMWEKRVENYRDDNPYYHAWLGDRAAETEDWSRARQAYERALDLAPGDSRVLYALGTTWEKLGRRGKAAEFIERAMEKATLRSEIEGYAAHLEQLRS